MEKKTVYGGAGTASSTEQNAETANVSGEAVADTASSSTKVYSYEYDLMGRVTKVTDPAEGRSEVTYDSAGRLIRKMESLYGELICSYNYTYDELRSTS